MYSSQYAHRRHQLFGALVAVAGTLALMVAPVSAHTIASASGTGNRTVIHGHHVPATQGKPTEGSVAGTKNLQLTIALKPRNTQALNALIAAQRDPSSPLYHHFLTPAQFTAQFGPTQDTVNTVVSFLRRQGLTVKSVAPNHLTISVSGSAAAVQNAFAVQIQRYNLGDRVAYAPANDPSVPSALAGSISAIGGLDNVAQPHVLGLSARVGPNVGSGPAGGYTPSELRTAYDMNNLLALGNTGAGQTIGVFELSNYNSTDVSHFRGHYGLGSTTITNTFVGSNSSTETLTGADEVELDLDVISDIAPNAALHVYMGSVDPNNPFAGFIATWQQVINDDTAPVISNSWGACEAAYAPADLSTLSTIFAQAASQGQTIFSASGDTGAFDCSGALKKISPDASSTTLAVDYPASDPNVVGVGGTTLTTGSGGIYKSETAWNCAMCAGGSGLGTGGGISSVFARPSYQTGRGVNLSANRQVPDVAADADPFTGYSEYCTVPQTGTCPSSGWTVFGGTSGAAPLWAGIAADVDQYLRSLGNPAPPLIDNTMLYQLFNASPGWPAYHDITAGNNLHYNATAGYDPTTGLGTPDVWNLARDMTRESYDKFYSPLIASPQPVSLTVFNGMVYAAWFDSKTGLLNLMHSTDGGKTFDSSTRIATTDKSAFSPSVVVYNNTLYVAWVGLGNNQINLMHSTDGGKSFNTSTRFTSANRSSFQVSLATVNNTLYVTWAGLGNTQINLMRSTDGGSSFDNSTKFVSRETTSTAPFLAVSGTTLYEAWTGRGNNLLNLMRSTDGNNTLDSSTKFVSSENSPIGISLADDNGVLYIAWTGGSNHFLNYMHSTDGNNTLNSGTKATIISETTQMAPALAFNGTTLSIVWVGSGNDFINILSRTLTP